MVIECAVCVVVRVLRGEVDGGRPLACLMEVAGSGVVLGQRVVWVVQRVDVPRVALVAGMLMLMVMMVT